MFVKWIMLLLFGLLLSCFFLISFLQQRCIGEIFHCPLTKLLLLRLVICCSKRRGWETVCYTAICRSRERHSRGRKQIVCSLEAWRQPLHLKHCWSTSLNLVMWSLLICQKRKPQSADVALAMWHLMTMTPLTKSLVSYFFWITWLISNISVNKCSWSAISLQLRAVLIVITVETAHVVLS